MKIGVPCLILALFSIASDANAKPHRCSAIMRKILNEGHFMMVCSPYDATFVLAGRTSGNRFSIYNYRYRFLPHPGGVMHGDQIMIVLQYRKYIGAYSITSSNYTNITVRGSNVVLKTKETREKVVLDFSRAPPQEIFVNGESETFSR